MVSTADGKSVIGERNKTAKGVGSATDQLLFRRLQKTADAIMVGSSTLRAGNVLYPPNMPRYVITRSGDIPLNNRFFSDEPEIAFVVAAKSMAVADKLHLANHCNLLIFGEDEVDLRGFMKYLLHDMGVRYLLCEGGDILNDTLLRYGLVDELFLTISNKLKGGTHLPSTVSGIGFSPGSYLPLEIISLYNDGDELYLRYRINQEPKLVVPD